MEPTYKQQVKTLLLTHGPMTNGEILQFLDIKQPVLSKIVNESGDFTNTPGPTKLFYVKGAPSPKNVETLVRYNVLQAIRLTRLFVHTVQTEGLAVANVKVTDTYRTHVTQMLDKLDELEAELNEPT